MIGLMSGLQSQFEKAEDSPGFLLWQVSNLWQRHIREALAPTGLTHAQFVLLASLAWLNGHKETVTQVRLAQHAKMDVMMTSDVLRTLEAKKLIRRVRDPRDRRAWNLEAEPQGLELANRANALVEAADTAFFAQLGSQNRSLIDLLHQLSAG